MNISNIFLASTLALMVGCSTSNTLKATNDYERQQFAQVERAVSAVPDWFIAVPKGDKNKIYVVGTGSSRNLSMARDKALLDAEKQLGNQIDALVSSQVKQYTREVGAGTAITIEDNELVIKKVVAEANVAGYQIDRTVVQAEGSQYRFYVMLAYSIGEDNVVKTLQDVDRLTRKFSGDRRRALRELDLEIEKKQQSN